MGSSVNPDAPLSQQAAEFAHALGIASIPGAIIERAKLLMLDSIGIALAASRYDFAQPTFTAAKKLGGSGPASVIGTALRLPIRDAALANGILVHGLDYDDTHMSSVVHTSASLLPATLAVAQEAQSSGADMLAAFIAGTELAARLGAVGGRFHKVGFHPTSVIGAFVSSLAAGRLMRLSASQLAHAQGIVLSFAAGTMQFLDDGSWMKRVHPGWAAASGITAAAYAQAGFIGVDLPYEGRFGLYATHLREPAPLEDIHALMQTLGSNWLTGEVAVKPFPACHFTHACADAALTLVGQGIRPSDVSQIIARVPQAVIPIVCEPHAQKVRPNTAYDAQFSIPYIVAASLVRGKFGLSELGPEALRDPAILSLAERVTHEVDAGAEFPRYFGGELVLQTHSGRRLVVSEPVNRGSSERPLSSDDIAKKFVDNAESVISREQARQIQDSVLSLDQTASLDRLTRALSPI
jgi:2-methylcitrate dehydratase PrpD